MSISRYRKHANDPSIRAREGSTARRAVGGAASSRRETTVFSQTVEYALRTVVWLATQKGAPRTTQEIAEAARIPAGYLSKVLQRLVHAGLLNSQRGLKGGFTLARPSSEISTLDVVNAVDPIRRIGTCPLGLESHAAGLCPLHRRLDDAIALVERRLAETKISDLIGRRSGRKALCE